MKTYTEVWAYYNTLFSVFSGIELHSNVPIEGKACETLN
jgi:hypothetical protein